MSMLGSGAPPPSEDLEPHSHAVHHTAEAGQRLGDLVEGSKAANAPGGEVQAEVAQKMAHSGGAAYSEGQATAYGVPAGQVVKGEHKE